MPEFCILKLNFPQTRDDDRQPPLEGHRGNPNALRPRLRGPYLFRVRDGRREALAAEKCLIHRQQGYISWQFVKLEVDFLDLNRVPGPASWLEPTPCYV